MVEYSYECCYSFSVGDYVCDDETQPNGCDLLCYGGVGIGDNGDCDECEGYTIPNCSPDPNDPNIDDCCPEWMLGSQYCDNENQCWGCDLSCYYINSDGVNIRIPADATEVQKLELGDNGDCCPVNDCPCSEGFIPNCNTDFQTCAEEGEPSVMKCCPDQWLGDGHCDNGIYGCNLRCYDKLEDGTIIGGPDNPNYSRKDAGDCQ